MAITKLIVGGFKSLRDRVEIPLAPITLMFGPNSAGKSSVRDAWFDLRRLLSGNVHPAYLDVPSWKADEHLYPFAHQKLSEGAERLGAVNDSSEVILGCAVDEFSIDDLPPLVDVDPWVRLGFGMCCFLGGDSVEYEMSVEPADHTPSFDLRVNGVSVLEYHSFVDAIWRGLVFRGELRSPEGDDKPEEALGLLRLNRKAISYHEMADRFSELELALTRTPSSWLKNALTITPDTISIRIDAERRRFQGWTQAFESPYEALSIFAGELKDVVRLIDGISTALNEFLRELECCLLAHLQIEHVLGGRGLLSQTDLKDTISSTSLATTKSRGLSYPIWLGFRSARNLNSKYVADFNEFLSGQPNDDFVNEMLGHGILAPKRYRFQSDLCAVEKIRLLPDVKEKNANRESIDFISSLYLEDECGRRLEIDQVGSGVSFLYPVLTSLWRSGRSFIEQPELHLHPRAQCEMGDVIIRAFNRGRFSIIETHSEHLLLRILRRIRETSAGKVQDRELACQPEAVAVLYFAPQEDGSTQVHQLRVSRGGDFMDRWPEGFFEERSRELFDDE